MAALAPIKGQSTIIVGQTALFTDETPNGIWSSSDPAVASVDTSGLVTAVSKGSCNIVYSVDTEGLGQNLDSIAITVTVNSKSVSNGLSVDVVYEALKDRLTWKSTGTASNSNRYYEDFHTLCDTEILKALQPNSEITDDGFAGYLDNLNRSVLLETINAIYNRPQLIDQNKLCFFRSDRLYLQTVANTSQFVGLNINLSQGDYVTQLSQLLLLFNADCTFDMHLYDDMLIDPIYTKTVTARAMEQTVVNLGEDVVFRNLTEGEINGGRKYFGYYQDDIASQGAQAMYYNLNYNRFHPCSIWAFSAPVVTDTNNNRNFNRYTIGANNLMYGLNAKVSTYRDATNNIIQNAQLFDELMGLTMAAKVVEMIIYSYRSNGLERLLQGNDKVAQLYQELNMASPSDQLPYTVGLKKKIERETYKVKQAFQKKKLLTVGTS